MPLLSSITINWWEHLTFVDKIIFKNGINLIIGKNGSGKTCLLKMLHDASISLNQNLSVEAKLLTDGAELVKIILPSDSDTEDVNVIINTKRINEGVWNSAGLLKDRVRYISSQRTVSSGNTSKNVLAQSQLPGDISVPTSDSSIDVAEEFNKAINRELYTKVLELTSGDPNFLKDMQDDYQNGLVDFEKTLKIDMSRENAVYFVDHREREVQIGNLSSGEKEYLYFYAFLRRIQSDESNIILIDEPELHSGEVLQYFISQANLVLLSKGRVTNISNTEQLKIAIEETGLPLDPSVFTAHWICAENDPIKTLKGEAAPTTPEVLSWIFGKDIAKRYWSFGSQRALAEAHISGLSSVLSRKVPIRLTVILDADKLSQDFTNYPPTVPASTADLSYLPFWELENLFLCPTILNKVITLKDDKNGFDRFWDLVTKKQTALKIQIQKTITKNQLRSYSPDKYISSDITADFLRWQTNINALNISPNQIDQIFDGIITSKKWQWIPGKEALGLVLEIKPDFWKEIRALQLDKQFKTELEKDPIIQVFIKQVENLNKPD